MESSYIKYRIVYTIVKTYKERSGTRYVMKKFCINSNLMSY